MGQEQCALLRDDMDNKELNIKSSTVEKGLELAKEFLGKLISPTIEEIRLLISDSVKYLRFKNQVRILLKAKDYVEKRNVKLKEIPIKILVPLLDKASLEEDERLQDKWSKMLTNMVDSELNLQNQVFPYILSQISLTEFDHLKKLLEEEKQHWQKVKELVELNKTDKYSFNQETKAIKREVDKIEQSGFWILLEEFERANLLRLGLVRQLPPKIYVEGGRPHDFEQWDRIEAEYDPDDFGYRITELGEKFLEICELKESSA